MRLSFRFGVFLMTEEYYLIFSAMISMRPLHRPLHSRFIYNADWLRMSEKQRETALNEGKFRLDFGPFK